MPPHPDSPLARLLGTDPIAPGQVSWIGLRPERRAPMLLAQKRAQLEVGQGIVGDRYRSKTRGKRGVTLIMQEHLAAIGACIGEGPVDPARLRRNIVTTGINLLALKGRRFRIGEAVLVGTGPCDPCGRMEEELGPGGYNAMRGHGGLTARVESSGWVKIGDLLERLPGVPYEGPSVKA